jgi:hypothetical protein
MKEFENGTLIKFKQEQQVKKKQEKKFVLSHSIAPIAGHRLYEINTKTLEIKEASYRVEKYITWEQALYLIKEGVTNKKVIINKDCEYISALNKENALKRYLSNKGSAYKIIGGKITF